jgi:hypothetical protein
MFVWVASRKPYTTAPGNSLPINRFPEPFFFLTMGFLKAFKNLFRRRRRAAPVVVPAVPVPVAPAVPVAPTQDVTDQIEQEDTPTDQDEGRVSPMDEATPMYD